MNWIKRKNKVRYEASIARGKYSNPPIGVRDFQGEKKETSLKGLCYLKRNGYLLISSLLLKCLFTFI